MSTPARTRIGSDSGAVTTTRPCALCHRPIPEGESHRMVAFGLVVHASVLQCGRRTAMSDARADTEYRQGVEDCLDDLESRAMAGRGFPGLAAAEVREFIRHWRDQVGAL